VLLRTARRWLTARATITAQAAAPFLPNCTIDLVQSLTARMGPRLPVLAKLVANNMRSADLYTASAFRAYFDQLALHLSNAVRIFRLGREEGAVARLAREQIEVDGSIEHLRHALEGGCGAVVAPPHVCNYLLTLVRLNQEVPVWVYLRWSKDRRKRELKHAWCRAAGLPVILEPESATDPASRAAACVEVLRKGSALVMTPDIAQKVDKGVPVSVLGRTAFLPTGPASIAMLAGAPLVPVFGRLVDDWHVIYAREPIGVESLPRVEGGRKAAIQFAMQAWTGHFEGFMRDCPQAWFLWGDSRWTRVFRGDPEYSGKLIADR
jgi:lauroyl/myristoyl acyltransferase